MRHSRRALTRSAHSDRRCCSGTHTDRIKHVGWSCMRTHFEATQLAVRSRQREPCTCAVQEKGTCCLEPARIPPASFSAPRNHGCMPFRRHSILDGLFRRRRACPECVPRVGRPKARSECVPRACARNLCPECMPGAHAPCASLECAPCADAAPLQC